MLVRNINVPRQDEGIHILGRQWSRVLPEFSLVYVYIDVCKCSDISKTKQTLNPHNDKHIES